MDQFIVPQFIEVEAKIIGPISARQFVEILVGLGLSYLWFRLFLSPLLFIPAIFFTLSITGMMAFAKVNSQTMHYFLLNVLQTLKRPRLKLWYRMPYQKPADAATKEEVAVVDKGPITESRLASVSLMVDTGGIYSSDDYRPAGAQVSALDQAPAAGQAPQPDGAPLPPNADNSYGRGRNGMNFGR